MNKRSWENRIITPIINVSKDEEKNDIQNLDTKFQKEANNNDLKNNLINTITSKFKEVAIKEKANAHVLFQALENREWDQMKVLLKTGTPVDARDDNGMTILMRATELSWNLSYLDTVNELLEKHADVNAIDNNGKTALMYAAERGDLKGMKLLLKWGADVNAKDNEGKTALMYAVEKGDVKKMQLLLEQGANADVKDNNGKTALIRVVEHYHYTPPVADVLNLLLEKTDVNAGDQNGETALMKAVGGYGTGNEDIMKLIMGNNKTDVNAKDNDGKTAFMHAAQEGKIDMMDLLLKNKGNVDDHDPNGFYEPY